MKITKENYEIYFIDYHEGRLTANQELLLFEFLENHPHLKAEFELYSSDPIVKDTVAYPQKKSLQHSVEDRPINASTVDEYCIAYLEKDLTDKGQSLFENYLDEHETAQKLLNIYKKTHLQREIHAFPGKNSLRKQTTQRIKIKTLALYLAAAASIIFFLLMYKLYWSADPAQIFQQTTNTEEPLQPDLKKLPAKEMEPLNNQMHYAVHSPATKLARAESNNQFSNITSENVLSKEQEIPKKIKSLQPAPFKTQWQHDLPAMSKIQPTPALASNDLRGELSIEAIKKRFLEESEAQKLNVWRLADAGLKGLEIISESEFELTPSRNNEGKVKSITFSTDNFTIKAPLKSKDDVTN